MSIFPENAPLSQKNAILKLSKLLEGPHSAARVGETCVVSTKVHVQDMRKPEQVIVIPSQDAGKVFYGRSKPSEILHMDIFHSEGKIPPREVAAGVISVLSGTSLESVDGSSPCSLKSFVSYIDIQTGLGGGRLDGNLNLGQEDTVLLAHSTHVHLTSLNVPEIRAVVPNMVAAVEASIERCGLQLRKVERVTLARATQPMDISDYQAASDSLLRQVDPSNMPQASWSFYKEALARQAAVDSGSVENARKILEALKWGLKANDFQKFHFDRDKTPDEIKKSLLKSNLAKFDGQKYVLTSEGEMALSFLKERALEVEMYLKRLVWYLPSKTVPRGEARTVTLKSEENRGRGVVTPVLPGQPTNSLATAETLLAVGLRKLSSESGVPASAKFLPEDLRFMYSREKKTCPLLLLIDASASMAGKRLHAAKELARHLVVTGRDKVAVVVFQDGDARIVSDFTRNLRKIESGLASIEAQGLTPLARGLEKAIELCSRFVQKPLVLCITDGIPTVPSKTLSPIDDALDVAREFARKRIRLGCIGLEPNRAFLKEMVRAAHGSLYIVHELEAGSLAAIAKKESAE